MIRLDEFTRADAVVVARIAQHRPLSETLVAVCDLVEHTLVGSRCTIARLGNHGVELTTTTASGESTDVIRTAAAAVFSASGVPVDPAEAVVLTDPATPDTRTIWGRAIVGLADRPIGVLFVSWEWPRATPLRPGVLDQATYLTQIALEQWIASQNLAATVAAERERIANELHDDPIQTITVVSMMLQRLGASLPEEFRPTVVDARRRADEAIERMRRMLFQLHPPALEEDGLAIALEVYLEELLEPLGVDCTFESTLGFEPDPETAMLAFQLAHEAIANVAAHAGAESVAVSLSEQDGGIAIVIADDGRGFDPATIAPYRPGHLGLSNVQYTARRNAGRFDVASTPGDGCTVSIWLPL